MRPEKRILGFSIRDKVLLSLYGIRTKWIIKIWTNKNDATFSHNLNENVNFHSARVKNRDSASCRLGNFRRHGSKARKIPQNCIRRVAWRRQSRNTSLHNGVIDQSRLKIDWRPIYPSPSISITKRSSTRLASCFFPRILNYTSLILNCKIVLWKSERDARVTVRFRRSLRSASTFPTRRRWHACPLEPNIDGKNCQLWRRNLSFHNGFSKTFAQLGDARRCKYYSVASELWYCTATRAILAARRTSATVRIEIWQIKRAGDDLTDAIRAGWLSSKSRVSRELAVRFERCTLFPQRAYKTWNVQRRRKRNEEKAI